MRILILAAEPGRIFGLDQQTFISVAIQLFNATFLAGIMTWLLYKPVGNMLAKRQNKIAKQLDNAAKDEAAAQYLKEQYQKKLEAIEAERKALLTQAKAEANSQSKQIIENAKVEAAKMIAEAKEEIAEEKQEMAEELRQQIIDIATLMTEKLIAKTLDKAQQEALIDEALAELEDLL